MTAGPLDRLTDEQQAVVDLPADARAFVMAGPGTGKTYLLVHRLAGLANLGLGSSEVVVLSFTNAVVGELCRRLAEAETDDGTYLRPTTIDSFAGRIVARLGEDPTSLGFDETVIRAAAAVRTMPELVRRVRHVLVDEAQDLVGPRLDFVTALLRSCHGGFTVLGDPAQGIYGFTRAGGEAVTGIDALSTCFPDVAITRLTQDHRSLRAGAAPGQELRELLLDETDRAAAFSLLRQRLQDCDRYSVAQLPTVLRRANSSTAVLCRTNGEALQLSGLLAGSGVTHTVRRAATANVPPAWVARLLRDVTSAELGRARFSDLASASEDWTARAWTALRRTAGSRSGGVDMALLRERLPGLKYEEAPDESLAAPVISTVHRSKGLEYESVILLEPDPLQPDDDQGEETRVLYVAMTRARRRTTRLERPDQPGRLARRRGRWVLLPWRGRRLTSIELRPGDVDPALDDDNDDEALRVEQARLQECVRVGDAVSLSLIEGRRVYAVRHKDAVIARTTERFASFSDSLPTRIDDVRIDALRSAATDPARTANLGLGGGGLYLVPELVGLGQLTWEDAGP